MNDEYIQSSLCDGNVVEPEEIIKSVSYNQIEIIRNIMKLYSIDRFDLDATYSTGMFYDSGVIQQPKIKSDIKPQAEGVNEYDCRSLPLDDCSISSIMFDPPFIASIPKNEDTGIISQRFGSYRSVAKDLWSMYRDALIEFYRILKKDGVLVFKCQDSVDAGKQCLSHIEIINSAIITGFYPKDLFVLIAKNRIIGKHHRNQQHSRKYHSYFLVFIKQRNRVKYSHLELVE